MIQYKSWEERLAIAGALPDRIRYTRKSTESGDRQVGSHDQQCDAADREWGPLAPIWVWQDNYTGTTFDRPQFQDMMRFCRANPRSRQSPGRIEMHDPSRFARILDAEGQPDVPAFQAVYAELTKLGWLPQFVTVKTSGDSLSDIVMLVLHAHMAASYSVALSNNVRRGMIERASQGWWTGGPAPWGTRRKDLAANRDLQDGERSSASGNTILVPNKVELRIWTKAANMILGGLSLDRVGQTLHNDLGIPGKRGGRMTHGTLRKLLSNPALVGRVCFRGHPTKEGIRPWIEVSAQWKPMVDVELFNRLLLKMNGRRLAGGPRHRRRPELFPLTLVCAHCGCEYNGGKLSEAQGGTRSYVHARPKARRGEEAHERFIAAGCKTWYVDAREIETKVKDLIVQQRASSEFEESVKGFLADAQAFTLSAATAVADAEKHLKRKKDAYKRALRTFVAVVGSEERVSAKEDDAVAEELQVLRNQVADAERSMHDAQRYAESGDRAFERLVHLIHETRNVARAWDRVGDVERRTILDYWVYAIYIAVEPVPGMKRANQKTAVVVLRTDPFAPLHFELPAADRVRRSKAARSAASTSASVSMANRASRALSADASPERPSDSAACDRTSGSASDIAATRAAPSPDDPRLPSTTAALRFKPRSFARFMAESLNDDANSSGDMASSSVASERASLPDTAGRAANSAMDSSRENLRLYGHTS
jgi:hypothetical protein